MKSRAKGTLIIGVAILIMFVLEFVTGASGIIRDTSSEEGLLRLGALNSELVRQGQLWRLFTSLFLHIGVLHLLLNVWALYQLGAVFEMMFGTPRFLLIYFATGVAASAASVFFTNGTAAGASGAIFGILGALITGIRRSPRWKHQSWTQNLVKQLLGWAALNVIIGFTVPGIDNAAHFGGFFAGLLFGLIPHRVPPPPPGQSIVEV